MKYFEFKLGGLDWKAIVGKHEGYRWKRHPETCEIDLPQSVDDRIFDQEELYRNLIDAVVAISVQDIMQQKKGKFEDHICGVASLVVQVIPQIVFGEPLTINSTKGGIQIGGEVFSIVTENKLSKDEHYFGSFNRATKTINLETINKYGKQNNTKFVCQTLIHECLHAINSLLGITDTDWETETVVNVLAHFLMEFGYSVKFIDTEIKTDEGVKEVS